MGNRRSNRSAFPLAVAGIVAGVAASPLVVAQELLDAEESERIVVTATRTEEKLEDVASSVTVITGEEIDQTQVRTVVDALRDVPAVDVARSGAAGGTASVFVRGANSTHTHVLVDGIEMNDPITPGRGADLAHLTTDNIERIEVIRGSQSTLYGSDAIGGVINIITKKGKAEPESFVSVEGGSFNSFKAGTGVTGKSGIAGYSVLATAFTTEGISAASEADGNVESDGYTNTSLSVRLSSDPTVEFGTDLFLRYALGSADIDNGGGPGKDDPNRVVDTQQVLFAAQARFTSLDESFKQRARLSLNDIRRDDDNDPDTDHPGELLRSSFSGRSVKGEWQGDLRVSETNLLTAGVEVEDERGSSELHSERPPFPPYEARFAEKIASTAGVYVQNQIRATTRLGATLGLRVDSHSVFGPKQTYRAAAVCDVVPDSSRIRATWGTGFKAPSIYQLYDASNGNADLSPEESTSWDVGFEQRLPGGAGSISATWFRTDFTNLVDWVLLDPVWFTGEYRNIGEAEAEGVELVASFRVAGGLLLDASYAYCRTQDNVTGDPLLRRPQHKYNLGLTHRFAQKGSVSLGVKYVSDRIDETGWPTVPVTLDQYTLVNLAAHYAVSDKITIHARIENLFDEEYEEVHGYGTPGFSVYVGAKAMF